MAVPVPVTAGRSPWIWAPHPGRGAFGEGRCRAHLQTWIRVRADVCVRSFVDHGEHGSGETLLVDLRPGRASAFDTATHITALVAALDQFPEGERGQVLVRADSAGASKAFLHHITNLGLEYSVGFIAAETVKTALDAPTRPGIAARTRQ